MKKSKNNNIILGFGYWVFEFGLSWCKGKVIGYQNQLSFSGKDSTADFFKMTKNENQNMGWKAQKWHFDWNYGWQKSFSFGFLKIGCPFFKNIPTYLVLLCPILPEIATYPKVHHPLWTFPYLNLEHWENTLKQSFNTFSTFEFWKPPFLRKEVIRFLFW